MRHRYWRRANAYLHAVSCRSGQKHTGSRCREVVFIRASRSAGRSSSTRNSARENDFEGALSGGIREGVVGLQGARPRVGGVGSSWLEQCSNEVNGSRLDVLLMQTKEESRENRHRQTCPHPERNDEAAHGKVRVRSGNKSSRYANRSGRFAAAFRFAACMEMKSPRLFCRLLGQVAGAMLLATLVCLPARCQAPKNFAIQQIAESPSSCSSSNVCLLRGSELCAGPIPADEQSTQSLSSDGAFKKAVRRFGRDQAEIYSAPFHRSSLKWDALFLAGTGTLIATDKNSSGVLPQDHLNVSRNISNAGLYGTSAAAGVLWLSGIATHDDHAREAGALSAEAFANTVPIYVGLQLIAGRERPIEGSGNGRFWRNNALNSSFPSAHALFTWSMATVIAHEYPRPWVKWLVYGTATAVSVTRFTGREHFPSDVVVGSALGYLIGRHIFQAHCKEGLSEGCHSRH